MVVLLVVPAWSSSSGLVMVVGVLYGHEGQISKLMVKNKSQTTRFELRRLYCTVDAQYFELHLLLASHLESQILASSSLKITNDVLLLIDLDAGDCIST